MVGVIDSVMKTIVSVYARYTFRSHNASVAQLVEIESFATSKAWAEAVKSQEKALEGPKPITKTIS